MTETVIMALLALTLAGGSVPQTGRAPIAVVAAENFYGDVAVQIGGADVTVRSILENPDQDPHLFEATPAVGRELAGARIVIYSGIGYDPWMDKFLAATRSPGRKVIVVARLIGRKPGDNPHIWYEPQAMKALAARLAALLIAEDPAHAEAYRTRLARFDASLRPLAAKIAALRARYAGTPVTATEPVVGYLFQALGLKVLNHRFQLAVMNGTEPGARDVGTFESDLRNHRVELLVYNGQATSPLAERMVTLAHAAGVPVVEATETEPPGKNYQQWMADELEAIASALAKERR